MRAKNLKSKRPLVTEKYTRRKLEVKIILEYGTTENGGVLSDAHGETITAESAAAMDDARAAVEMAINPDYSGAYGLRLINVEVESITPVSEEQGKKGHY